MGIEGILWAIGGFIIVLTPIVLVHELGHFWAARLSNIRIEEFGIGLPPRAAVIGKRNGTIYSLNWIPLGGFVRPAGEDDPNVAGGLASASKRARFFVLIAGALANAVMAVVIFWVALMIGPPAVSVVEVDSNSPALAAGLQAGDIILEVEGRLADNTNVVAGPMYEQGGQPVTMRVDRSGQLLDLTVIPRAAGAYDPETEGPLGVRLGAAEDYRIQRAPVAAAVASVDFMVEYTLLFVRLPLLLIQGDIEPSDARPVSVVGISQIAGQAAEASATNRDLFPILSMIAFINLALGLTNLLPIPALDGGRILFVVIEAVRGRRIEPEREGMVHVAGMLFLLGLMVLLIVQDIVNPIIPF
ncbi:MAG: M50 family metallopeptidase [Chloroflexota bacterium]|jgi:regulator of sigma E protease